MLIGIPHILSPQLLKILSEMGHGDRIVIADGNFPAESVGKNCQVVHMEGHGVPEILKAVLEVMPLDTYTKKAVYLMERVPGDNAEVVIWDEYSRLVEGADARGKETMDFLERFAFYEAARGAYAVIATSESALYANILLQKGVVTD